MNESDATLEHQHTADPRDVGDGRATQVRRDVVRVHLMPFFSTRTNAVRNTGLATTLLLLVGGF
jgi:hypothetical protein